MWHRKLNRVQTFWLRITRGAGMISQHSGVVIWRRSHSFWCCNYNFDAEDWHATPDSGVVTDNDKRWQTIFYFFFNSWQSHVSLSHPLVITQIFTLDAVINVKKWKGIIQKNSNKIIVMKRYSQHLF